MPMDLSYTDLAGLYPHNEGVYHVLFMCPQSLLQKPLGGFSESPGSARVIAAT